MSEHRSYSYIPALEAASVALDDWINLYAPELCDGARVRQAQKRIAEKGTLAYIADVQQGLRAAIQALSHGPNSTPELRHTPVAPTQEQRRAAEDSGIHDLGDCRLQWVLDSDLYRWDGAIRPIEMLVPSSPATNSKQSEEA